MIKCKALNKDYCFFLLFFVICLIFFNFSMTGCGMDVFYYVQNPVQSGYKPEVDNSAVDAKFFQFSTQEGVSSAGFSMIGTDVYYKIYTDKSVWRSESSDLIQLADSGNVNAADKLISTGYGYGYEQLKVAGRSENVLIPFTGSSKTVSIRLTDYSNMAEFAASMKVDGSFYGIPVRYNGKSFNIGRVRKNDKPSIGDADVKGSSVPGDNKWYVCLFAASRGHDAAYTNYYSNISYLGSVTIDGNNPDN